MSAVDWPGAPDTEYEIWETEDGAIKRLAASHMARKYAHKIAAEWTEEAREGQEMEARGPVKPRHVRAFVAVKVTAVREVEQS